MGSGKDGTGFQYTQATLLATSRRTVRKKLDQHHSQARGHTLSYSYLWGEAYGGYDVLYGGAECAIGYVEGMEVLDWCPIQERWCCGEEWGVGEQAVCGWLTVMWTARWD